MQINGCIGGLLRGVTGFKLVFQSKCIRMDVAACVVHVLIVSSAKKKATYETKCFYGTFRFEKRLLKPELLSATVFATADSILSISFNKTRLYRTKARTLVTINHVSLINTPSTTVWGVKTSSDCKPDQTLLSATINKNGKKRSGYARLRFRLSVLLQILSTANY